MPHSGDVAAGWAHACVIDHSARAWCYGSNGAGQLGSVRAAGHSGTPVLVDTPMRWTSVTAGGAHTCALRA